MKKDLTRTNRSWVRASRDRSVESEIDVRVRLAKCIECGAFHQVPYLSHSPKTTRPNLSTTIPIELNTAAVGLHNEVHSPLYHVCEEGFQ